MSTNANIGLETADGGVEGIYSHWDGYPSWLGDVLINCYNTGAAVSDLIQMGDVSILAASIEKPEGHTFEKPKDGYSVFYGRDRGDRNSDAVMYLSKRDFVNDGNEFVYIWTLQDEWVVACPGGKLKPLAPIVAKELEKENA